MTDWTDRLRDQPRIRTIARRLRTSFWKLYYGTSKVDSTFLLSRGCALHRDFTTGPFGFMNERCRVCAGVTVGKYVMFGPEVSIVGADHRFSVPGSPMIFSGRPDMPPTIIEDDVWLGSRSIILAGTRIERGSIVAAGAVVTTDVPAYSIVAGVPARVIRERFGQDARAQHDAMLEEAASQGAYCPPRS